MSMRSTISLAAVMATLLFGGVALADDKAPETKTPPATTEETNAGLAEALPSKLQVHGYLSQAYARADQHQIIGIPTDGTADYRSAALQFRYSLTKSDTFVLQLAHERLGNSILEEEDIELDWGFYERRFGANTGVKVGRVQIPFGIYNEIRDVGTLIPFYRTPFNFYGEEAYTSETLDGIAVAHRFAADSPWTLDASAYYGGWDTVQVRETAADGEINDAVGVELWLSTPVDGLRIGTGGYHAVATRGFLEPGESIPQTVLHASLDGNFERILARAEVRRTTAEGVADTAMYAQLGYRFTPRVMVTVQADQEHIHIPAPFPFAPDMNQTVGRDVAAAVNYFFRPDLVLKVEAHRNRHVSVEDAIPSFFDMPRADYAIVSLSVSF